MLWCSSGQVAFFWWRPSVIMYRKNAGSWTNLILSLFSGGAFPFKTIVKIDVFNNFKNLKNRPLKKNLTKCRKNRVIDSVRAMQTDRVFKKASPTIVKTIPFGALFAKPGRSRVAPDGPDGPRWPQMAQMTRVPRLLVTEENRWKPKEINENTSQKHLVTEKKLWGIKTMVFVLRAGTHRVCRNWPKLL